MFIFAVLPFFIEISVSPAICVCSEKYLVVQGSQFLEVGGFTKKIKYNLLLTQYSKFMPSQ